MRVVYERSCRLDVHQKTISACLITPSGHQRRSFGTTTAQLRELADWLKQSGCAHVAMKSTGIYWLPIFNVFEQGASVPCS